MDLHPVEVGIDAIDNSGAVSVPDSLKKDAPAEVTNRTGWIKLCFEGDYTGAKRIVSVVTRGTSDDCNSIALDKNAAFLEMARIGDVVFLYASETGRDWYMIRVLNFKFEGKLRLGFLAQTPEGDSNRVHFSHIKYTPTAMKDYWKGE